MNFSTEALFAPITDFQGIFLPLLWQFFFQTLLDESDKRTKTCTAWVVTFVILFCGPILGFLCPVTALLNLSVALFLYFFLFSSVQFS